MNKSIRIAALAALAGLPLVTQAADLSYTYVDGGWLRTDVDVGGGVPDVELDGGLLRGSVALSETFFVTGDFASQSGDLLGVDFDLDRYELALGMRWGIADNTDLYGKLGWTKAELDVSGAIPGIGTLSTDDDGYSVTAGLRSMLTDRFEGELAVNYTDFGDGADGTSGRLGGRWFFTEAFAAGVEVEFDEDATTYGIGVRYQFK